MISNGVLLYLGPNFQSLRGASGHFESLGLVFVVVKLVIRVVLVLRWWFGCQMYDIKINLLGVVNLYGAGCLV